MASAQRGSRDCPVKHSWVGTHPWLWSLHTHCPPRARSPFSFSASGAYEGLGLQEGGPDLCPFAALRHHTVEPGCAAGQSPRLLSLESPVPLDLSCQQGQSCFLHLPPIKAVTHSTYPSVSFPHYCPSLSARPDKPHPAPDSRTPQPS